MTYITKTASTIRIVRLATVSRKTKACPWKLPRTSPGSICFAVRSTKSVACPIVYPGLRLKKSETLVNWLMWLTTCGPTVILAAVVLNLDENLILIVRLLDQIRVVLRVRRSQEAEDPRLRDAVQLRLVPE